MQKIFYIWHNKIIPETSRFEFLLDFGRLKIVLNYIRMRFLHEKRSLAFY